MVGVRTGGRLEQHGVLLWADIWFWLQILRVDALRTQPLLFLYCFYSLLLDFILFYSILDGSRPSTEEHFTWLLVGISELPSPHILHA
jgi:hypothetical protein